MRSLSSNHEQVYACEAGYRVHVKVTVSQDSGSTWHNLRSLKGRDFVLAVEWGETVDELVSEAKVTCVREQEGWSLSPFVEDSPLNLLTGSYDPLLQEGNTLVKIDVAPVSLSGPDPSDSEYVNVFDGVLHAVDMGGGGHTFDLVVRDKGQYLMDAFIESEVQYGSTLGEPVQEVMQAIVNATITSSPPLVWTEGNPDWVLGPYIQRLEPVLTALDLLAKQIGWNIRYRYYDDGISEEYVLLFHSPDRDKVVPDWTMETWRQLSFTSWSVDADDVRNVVQVVYSDRNDLDASGVAKRKTYTASDATSIATYRRRWMQIAEAASSNINTAVEAQRLAEAALSDLATPMVEMEVETHFFHPVQLGDLIRLEANEVHHSEDLDLAVTSIRHSLPIDGAVTTRIGLRGKPMATRKGWLERMASPGVAKPAPFTGPGAPTNLSTQATPSGFRLKFDPPVGGAPAKEYELHVSTSSGFTPDSSTRRVVGSLTEMVVTDLTPGTTYYAKIVPRDEKGNRGTASAEQTLVARYVEPRLLQPRITWGNLPLNGDFEASSDTTAPPDGWSMLSGTWGTDVNSTSDAYSGSRAVVFSAAVNAELGAQLFTSRTGEVLLLTLYYKSSTSSPTVGTVRLDFYTAALGTAGSESLTLVGTGGAWTRDAVAVRVGASVRYCQVVVSRETTDLGTLTVDGVEILRVPGFTEWVLIDPAGEAGSHSVFQNDWANYNETTHEAAQYRFTDLGEVELRGEIIAPTPAPPAAGTIFVLPNAPAKAVTWRLVTSTGTVLLELDTSGNLKADWVTAGTRLSLQGLNYFV